MQEEKSLFCKKLKTRRPKKMSDLPPWKRAKLFGNTDTESEEEQEGRCPPKPREIPDNLKPGDSRMLAVMDLTVRLPYELRTRQVWLSKNFSKLRPIRELSRSCGRVKRIYHGQRFFYVNLEKFPVKWHWTATDRRTNKKQAWLWIHTPGVTPGERVEEWMSLAWALKTKHRPDGAFYVFKHNLFRCDPCWQKIGDAMYSFTIDPGLDHEENMEVMRSARRKMKRENTGDLKSEY